MWRLRSPVVPADQVTPTETRKVANQTGEAVLADRSKQIALLGSNYKLTRDGQQKSLDLAVPKSLNDAREEVLERLRQDGQVLREHKEVQAVVREAELDALPDRARVRVVGLVDVHHQAPAGKVALFFAQPFGRGWVVGEDEAGGDGHTDRDHAFDDEEPPPACDAHAAVQVLENAGGLRPSLVSFIFKCGIILQ